MRAVNATASYEEQLQAKMGFIREHFEDLVVAGLNAELLTPPRLEVRRSPEKHFRMRTDVEVDLASEDDPTLNGHGNACEEVSPISRGLYRLTWDVEEGRFCVVANFPVETLAWSISLALPILGSLLGECRFASLRKRLVRVKFHATLTKDPGQILVCLVYRPQSAEQMRVHPSPALLAEHVLIDLQTALKGKLAEDGSHSEVIVIAKGRGWQQCIPAEHSFVDERLVISGNLVHYRQPFGQFSNPNPHVAIATAEWLQSVIRAACCNRGVGSHGAECDLLELYCGAGSHTVALAPLFRHVLAVEINRQLASAAQHNVEANNLCNVTVLRSPSQDFCRHVLLSRSYELHGKDGASCHLEFGCTVVDPPRAGLDKETLEAVAGYDHVFYISCSPAALRKDMEALLCSHSVCNMVLLDHFPFTQHLETGVYFRRRTADSACGPSLGMSDSFRYLRFEGAGDASLHSAGELQPFSAEVAHSHLYDFVQMLVGEHVRLRNIKLDPEAQPEFVFIPGPMGEDIAIEAQPIPIPPVWVEIEDCVETGRKICKANVQRIEMDFEILKRFYPDPALLPRIRKSVPQNISAEEKHLLRLFAALKTKFVDRILQAGSQSSIVFGRPNIIAKLSKKDDADAYQRASQLVKELLERIDLLQMKEQPKHPRTNFIDESLKATDEGLYATFESTKNVWLQIWKEVVKPCMLEKNFLKMRDFDQYALIEDDILNLVEFCEVRRARRNQDAGNSAHDYKASGLLLRQWNHQQGNRYYKTEGDYYSEWAKSEFQGGNIVSGSTEDGDPYKSYAEFWNLFHWDSSTDGMTLPTTGELETTPLERWLFSSLTLQGTGTAYMFCEPNGRWRFIQATGMDHGGDLYLFGHRSEATFHSLPFPNWDERVTMFMTPALDMEHWKWKAATLDQKMIPASDH